MGHKKTNPTYERKGRIKTKITEPLSGNVSINLDENGVTIQGENGKEFSKEVTLIRYRERMNLNKKEKIVSSYNVPQFNNTKKLNMIDVFLDYDYICAVDTNTIYVEEYYFSISAMISTEVSKIKDAIENRRAIQIQVNPNICTYYSETQQMKIEENMWISAIDNYQSQFGKDKKILLIVDSALDKIDSYNKRESMINDEILLPERVQLMYASADNSDTWANQLIMICDKVASYILKYSKEYGIQNTFQALLSKTLLIDL